MGCCCPVVGAQTKWRESSGAVRTGLVEPVPETPILSPPPEHVADCIAKLEQFIHAEDDLPVLVKTALAHVQFETIHPFLDGNGRLGRVLIVLAGGFPSAEAAIADPQPVFQATPQPVPCTARSGSPGR